MKRRTFFKTISIAAIGFLTKTGAAIPPISTTPYHIPGFAARNHFANLCTRHETLINLRNNGCLNATNFENFILNGYSLHNGNEVTHVEGEYARMLREKLG